MIRPLALALMLVASPALATTQDQINATLAGDASIWSRLRTLAVADQIRLNCPKIEAREWNARFFLLGLYNDARGYGFSRDQIRAFQRNEALRGRLRADVVAYFTQHGVREGESQSFCALGRSEIAAGTPAGELLRAR